jgi:hypothetical protein
VIKLGDPTPMNLSQLYRGQLVSMKVTEFEPIETTSNVLWIGAIQQVTQADKKECSPVPNYCEWQAWRTRGTSAGSSSK